MDKYFLCHTTLIDYEGDICALKGQSYLIIEEDKGHYAFTNEEKDIHYVTKELDINGLSFTDWFEIVCI